MSTTKIPGGAVFEAELAGGVALWDVSTLLPKHPTKRYPARPLHDICRVYVHHSGALGAAGVKGAENSARYEVTTNAWPGAAYHYWIPAESLLDDKDRLVVLRMQHDDVRSFHTGGAANGHGIGVALQGNTTAAPLTHSHVECLEALLPWLRSEYDLRGEWLSWHSDSKRWGGTGKSSCPGRNAEAWLRAYRSSLESAAQ